MDFENDCGTEADEERGDCSAVINRRHISAKEIDQEIIASVLVSFFTAMVFCFNYGKLRIGVYLC